MAKKLTSKKARKILHDKSVHGNPLTEKQRKFFGAIAGGAEPYKAQVGTMLTALPSNMMDRLSDVLAFPQRAITKLFTGEYQTPSEAMKIQNPVGALATDILLDPVNLLGAGLAGNASKATKATKAASSAGKKSVVYTSDLLSDPRAEKAMTEGYISSKRNIDRFSQNREALRDNETWKFSPEDLKRHKAQQALEEDMRLYHGIHPEPVINLQKLNPESVLFDMRKSHVKEFKNVPGGSEWKSSASPYVSKSEMAKFKTHEDLLKSKAKEKYKELVREYPKDYKISPLEFMNLPKNENGGWLDKYEQGGMVLKQKTHDNYGTKPNVNDDKATYPDGFVGWEYDITGRNYSPAWGGQFQNGGNLRPAMAGAPQPLPLYQMGGSLPGAVGFMYARTQNPAPSNGPYAKKTKASAQNGQEMKFYQEGLDFTPKTISQNGSRLYVADPNDPRLKTYQDSLYNYNIGRRIAGILDADKNLTKVKPGSPYDKWLHAGVKKAGNNLIDNTEIGTAGYKNYEKIASIMKEYQAKGNKGILPIRYQGYFPNPDNTAMDLITLRDFWSELGFVERRPGPAHMPVWKKPEQQVILDPSKTSSDKIYNEKNIKAKPPYNYPEGDPRRHGLFVRDIDEKEPKLERPIPIPRDVRDLGYSLPTPGAPSFPKLNEYNPNTPTKYSFTYPTGKYNEQKTMYFPTRSAWKSFTEGVRGASSQEGVDYGTSTGNLQDGGEIAVDSMGYWNPDNWGNPVIIPSTDITMEGVYEPLVGISDTGDVQYMEPGEDYEFDGEYVTEYPVARGGVSVNNADAQPIEKLDQLLNFTNYNKPTKGGWLDKYQ